MSQVIENRALVTLTVRDAPAARADGWLTTAVTVVAASDLPGAVNLLAEPVPRDFTALLPPGTEAAAGDEIMAVASLVGPGMLRLAAPAAPESP